MDEKLVGVTICATFSSVVKCRKTNLKRPADAAERGIRDNIVVTRLLISADNITK